MNTICRLLFQNAANMSWVPDETVALVVTSPPYPMIEMWDELFCTQDPKITEHLENNRGKAAFEGMHGLLDRVWKEVYRVLIPGGIACINIGDATRKVGDEFQMFPNHARILSAFSDLGFCVLPEIIWRKQTNAPNKFMGSGMLPAGAYVTLEHEFILVVRKGGKRDFSSDRQKANRQKSAYFWEERNHWFSDVWMDIKGASQVMAQKQGRKRNAAFPYEISHRLVAMYSVLGDTVLDPFLGTGTTLFSAMALGRNGIGYELDKSLAPVIQETALDFTRFQHMTLRNRLLRHAEFIRRQNQEGKPAKYVNEFYGFAVKTRQEQNLRLPVIKSIRMLSDDRIEVDYHKDDSEETRHIRAGLNSSETLSVPPMPGPRNPGKKPGKKPKNVQKAVQKSLFQ